MDHGIHRGIRHFDCEIQTELKHVRGRDGGLSRAVLTLINLPDMTGQDLLGERFEFGFGLC